jgi:hypothetical protein
MGGDMRDIPPGFREAAENVRRSASLVPSEAVMNAIELAQRIPEAMYSVGRSAAPLRNPAFVAAVADARRLHRMLLSMQKQGERLEQMLLAIGWPPPGDLPAALVDEITRAYEAGNLSPQDVEDLFVRVYSADRVGEILAGWEKNERLAHRLQILREAIRAHVEGRYGLSIPTLIAQIDGVIAEAFAHEGWIDYKTIKAYVEVAFGRGSRFDRAGAAFFLRVLFIKFNWGDSIPKFSRHAILHGADVHYATAANSLRTILFLNQLQQNIGYVSAAHGRRFHLVTCRAVRGKKKKLRRSYATPYEAASDGLQPCLHCLPHLTQRA